MNPRHIVWERIRHHETVCESVFPPLLQVPFARQFAGMNEQEIDRMMESFDLKNCCQRGGWVRVVRRITGVE